MSRQDGVLRTTGTHGTHQTAKERLMVLRGLSKGEPGEPLRAYSAYILRRSKPDKLLSREDFLRYIDLELDALIACV